MQPQRRRIVDLSVMSLGAVGLAGSGAAAGLLSNTERVTAAWIGAEVPQAGDAHIVEIYDYEFAFTPDRHGIKRDIPNPAPRNVVVSSATAPDELLVGESRRLLDGTELRIGRADVNVSGRHRYQIDYDYDRAILVRDLANGDVLTPTFSWNAIGPAWVVGFDEVTAVVVSNVEFVDPICSTGALGADGGCTVTQTEPGRLETKVSGLDAGEALTITAGIGPELSAMPVISAAPTEPIQPGPPILVPAVAMGGAALLAGGATSRVLRRAGRERVSAGGAADAAYAAGVGERRVDPKELAEMATTEFAPPKELTPSQGGVIHAEKVLPQHKAAWLMSEAVQGSIAIDGTGKDLTITRAGLPGPASSGLLNQMFTGRQSLELGTYDASFAAGWSTLDSALNDWRNSSGDWDPAGERRRKLAMGLGALAMVAGAVLAIVVRASGASAALSALCAVPAAIGLACLVGAWELRVRTAKGSSEWLRVESFRRFLHDSEAQHVEQAHRLGVLREYTAWAVALGEVDHWSKAMASAGTMVDPSSMSMMRYAPFIVASTSSTSTQPTSSGSSGGGGFGGGSSGSGGGGGGGGSW
jgi:uncharacterized membrane protein YgcG